MPPLMAMAGDSTGGLSDAAKLSADLAHERSRATELERTVDELRRRDRQKDEFISNVSHELRTSLASVKNVISNALAGVSGDLPDKLRRSLLLADDNIKRFSHIINDLLDVARLESGKMALHRSMVDPVRVVAGVVASFEEEAAKRGITLRSNWSAPPTFVFMDGDRIAQVVGNLIGNALKFTPWGGTIGVRGFVVDRQHGEISGEALKAIPEEAAMAIEVADTGPGLDPDRVDRIFDRFEQAEAPVSHSGEEGLGLGLAICRQLVALHGGQIWVVNAKSGGARFTFTIPFLGQEEMFRQAISDRLRTATIHHYPLALVLIDLAQTGALDRGPPEEMVLGIEAVIRQVLRRKSDTLMWRGGGRFAVILPQTTAEEGKAVVRRILEAMQKAPWRAQAKAIGLEARSAIAGVPGDPDDAPGLIGTAEERLASPADPSETNWSEVL